MTEDTTQRIFAAIETERKERRFDIAEINNRIDEVLKAINNISKPVNGNGKIVTATIAIITLFATVTFSVSRLTQQHLNILGERLTKVEEHANQDGHPIYHSATLKNIEGRMIRIEERNGEKIDSLDERVKVQMYKEAERTQARLVKLEEWQRWWYRSKEKDKL